MSQMVLGEPGQYSSLAQSRRMFYMQGYKGRFLYKCQRWPGYCCNYQPVVCSGEREAFVKMAIASMIFDLIISNWPYITLVGVIIYCLHLVIYRLLLSPVAGFPGPKLAGLTFWYEFYFDVIKRGSYFRQIEKLHCQYGMLSWSRFPRTCWGIMPGTI